MRTKMLGDPSDEALFYNLRQHGAPLVRLGVSGDTLSLEETLGYALALSRRRADVARVWPVVLAKNRSKVNLVRLESLARYLGQERALGFFLSVVRTFFNDQDLMRAERRLRDGKAHRVERFFLLPRNNLVVALEEKRTPSLAKQWFFSMNATLEWFEACLRRSVGHATVR